MDCNWLGLSTPCIEYFSFVPTDDGLCCTFNGGRYSDPVLGLESPYEKNNVGWNSYTIAKPFRIFEKNRMQEALKVKGNGYRMGLSLVIDANVSDYAVTNGKFDGFKVLK